MSYYERTLPHWHPEGRALFITWRLFRSLPATAVVEHKEQTPGQIFVGFDRSLDRADCGPVWLKDQRVAQCVVDALRHGQDQMKLYKLHAYVVMANHVHVLLTPELAVARITKSIKGFTAHRANQILERTGPFWHRESYDHWIRDDREFQKIVAYIERNPVSAGLVEKIEDWPWSSAFRK